jgi:hypothetical protein
MADGDISASPQRLARLGGVLYLIIIAIGIFGEVFVRGRLIVAGDVAATAANIRMYESLWRAGIAAELVLLVCATTLAGIVFVLLRPAGRDLAFLATLFNVVAIAVEAAITMYLLQALFPLGSDGYLKAFPPEQLYALTRLALRWHAHGFAVSLVFFACFCLIVGYLIFRSGYLPKAIGVLMQLAGVCYLVNSFTLLLAPAVANRLFPVILLPPFVGETSLALWLLVKGVNVEKWGRVPSPKR